MSTDSAPKGRPSLKSFDPYADRNGQDFGQGDPLDVARPNELRTQMTANPSGPAETARLASGQPRADAVSGGSVASSDETAAETPSENLRRIGDAGLGRRQAGPVDEAGRPVRPDADLAAASAPGACKPGEDLRERQDRLLDEAVEETFPASDPIAPKRITR